MCIHPDHGEATVKEPGEMFQVTTLDLENVPKTEEGKVDYSQDFFLQAYQSYGKRAAGCGNLCFCIPQRFTPSGRPSRGNSNTTRHAAEFWMIEPEMAFADLKDDMMLAEGMLKYVIRYVLDNAPEEMAFFNQFVDKGLIDVLNMCFLPIRACDLYRGY